MSQSRIVPSPEPEISVAPQDLVASDATADFTNVTLNTGCQPLALAEVFYTVTGASAGDIFTLGFGGSLNSTNSLSDQLAAAAPFTTQVSVR
jgi:hypothetical protein